MDKVKKIQDIAEQQFSQNGKVRVQVQLNSTKSFLFIIIENNFHTIIMFSDIERFLLLVDELISIHDWKSTIIENTGTDTVLRIIVKDID